MIFYQILSTYPFKEMYRDQFEELVRVKRVYPLLTRMQNAGGGEETRSGTEKRCPHKLQSGHQAWWSADNYSIFPKVNILEARILKRTGRGNQKCLKN